MRHTLLTLAALLWASATPLAAQATGQQAQAKSEWLISERTALLKLAGVGFPTEPGGLAITDTRDFSHPGEAIDAAILYESGDRQVFATAYVYLPGLAHSGIAALATDWSIRSNSTSPVQALGSSDIRVAGVEGAAIRTAYDRYRGTLTSRAGFVKAGRYLVKLRVSGPEARRKDVDAAFDDLAAGIQVGSDKFVYPAAPVAVGPCATAETPKAARRKPASSAEVAALALFATFDGSGMIAREVAGGTTPLPSRVPTSLCSAKLSSGHLVLRAEPGPAAAFEGRTRLLVILSDGGEMLEVVETANFGHVMLHHRIGGTAILSAWDGVPANDQIERMLTGADRDATKVLATVVLRPDKGAEINIAVPPDPRLPRDHGTR
ncbi:hypothetical protein [Sphingosinicella sp. BN140058]|uniref:hypothetical protein n=1 Tax=Sphingosinicella sp. BN140058 TaxID=1892855 RepID=UPI001012068F|nr:hypothetical protein [Sphingosinicella sp. BN140058]QAY79382.1 hypothetical protein ETR14_24695 [Sphingosinicella sp. BN140058]